jgi:hypothetical protein
MKQNSTKLMLQDNKGNIKTFSMDSFEKGNKKNPNYRELLFWLFIYALLVFLTMVFIG